MIKLKDLQNNKNRNNIIKNNQSLTSISNATTTISPIKNFQSQLDDSKVSPLRLKGVSRLNQIYLSRMILQCSPSQSASNYEAQYINQQGLMIIQSKSPLKAFNVKNAIINKNNSRSQFGKKYIRKISQLQSCLNMNINGIKNNANIQEKQDPQQQQKEGYTDNLQQFSQQNSKSKFFQQYSFRDKLKEQQIKKNKTQNNNQNKKLKIISQPNSWNKRSSINQIEKQDFQRNDLTIHNINNNNNKISYDKQRKSKNLSSYSSTNGTTLNNNHHNNFISNELIKNNFKNYHKHNNSHQFSINNYTKKLPQLNLNNLNNKRSSSNLHLKDNINANKKQLPLLARVPQQLKNIKAQSYVILQYPSNSIVVSYQANMSVQIASLTKIMTFYQVLKIAKKQNINIFTEIFQVNEHAMEVGGTSAEVHVGQVYTIQQLFYGLMLPSGNDAATCLAQWGGRYLTQQDDSNVKIKYFVMEMNKTAKSLGLINTRFGNPHGLPHFQSKSNAFQVAKLSSICMNEQIFKIVVSTEKYQCKIQNKILNTSRDICYKNTNKLLRRQNFIGIKTGITVTAGPCLATAYKFRDKIYITVVLRANKISRRFKQTRRLLYWALNKLHKDLSEKQKKIISSLNKKKTSVDSDYSQDQQQFDYSATGDAQFKKRCQIINCQM